MLGTFVMRFDLRAPSFGARRVDLYAAALDMAKQHAGASHRPLLVLISDGRATAGDSAVADAESAAAMVRQAGVPAVVVDAEEGPVRLGLARRLAELMGARYITIPQLAQATGVIFDGSQ